MGFVVEIWVCGFRVWAWVLELQHELAEHSHTVGVITWLMAMDFVGWEYGGIEIWVWKFGRIEFG